MESNELDNPPMVYQTSSHLHRLSNLTMREDMSVNRSTQCYDEEKTMMLQIATLAMQELERLVRVNEPFWINFSNTHQDERYTLDHERYCQFFPKNNHIRGDNVSKESSKYSGIIGLDGMKLVDMFLDSDKWRNLFPTIVTKAETTKVLEIGLPGNRDGALLLMNEEMHILSPLVRPREFNIIRYCKQVDVDVWVITDVSFDSSRPNTPPLSHSWKHPSGCIIREMPNKSCLVTWVEHVEVEDMLHTHHIFRDFVVNNTLYGAESWIKELQRMCERFFSFYAETVPAGESIGVIQTIEGRRSVMKLADRMVKIFCECLRMAGQLEFQHLNLESSIGGVRVSLRQATDIGQGIVVAAATTLCLPLPAEYVFDFLKDPTKRYQWDVMAYENPMYEIGHVSNGLNPGNYTTIFQPYNPSENSTMILQESFTSPVGSYVIYAPIDIISMNAVICGEDSTKLPIIPTGFVVCPYAQPNATFEASNNIGSSSSGGVGRGGANTLLTLAYQILTCNPNGIDQHQNMEAFATMNTLLTTSVLKVRGALMNSY
ncbi:putative homeobox leucine zipper protein [Trifolium pratense]|uniref:Putative homeobox leucine zipper protein n=1 Tax=Trifolium pratense TaxID=57577 RepID=A0A2K3NUT5_TRIPR|nr:putative homeobox leucine zipper protein [Trifolium pratense]